MDGEISQGRMDAYKMIYLYRESFGEAKEGFIEFSIDTGRFGGYDVLKYRGLRILVLGGKIMGKFSLFYNN